MQLERLRQDKLRQDVEGGSKQVEQMGLALPYARFHLLVTNFMGSHYSDSGSNNSSYLASGLQLWRRDLERGLEVTCGLVLL